ncbi:Calcipressin [Mycotypha africana]|uniref:Calcipressin n=1 Tax=Mycotypha africana TaxID=64632 RepID=UPI0023009080|nr:Calcipressin [Mycotypha africana]KAI8991849.1 Calcipressin [Mycotypha africana]
MDKSRILSVQIESLLWTNPDTVNLQVPQFQRNLLISPPGSPFEGWEQIEEDAPNQKVLASDLMHAADMSDFELDDDVLDLSSPTASKNDGMDEQEDSAEEAGSTAAIASLPSDSSKTSLKTVSIVCAKGSETPDHLPSITVQDWDGQDDQLDIDESMNIRKKKLSRINKMVPTAMPPTTSSVFEQSS